MISSRSELLPAGEERTRELERVIAIYTELIERAKTIADNDIEGCHWIGAQFYPDSDNPYLWLEKYIKTPPVPAKYYRNRRFTYGALARDEEMRQDALAEIEVLKSTASNAVDFYLLGWAYIDTEHWEDAITALQKAIDLDNKGVEDDVSDAADYHLLGQAYYGLKNFKMAKDALNKAIRLQLNANPMRTAVYYRELGDIYREEGDYSTAISMYTTAKDNWAKTNIASIHTDLTSIAAVYREWAEKSQEPSRLKSAAESLIEAANLPLPESDKAGLWYQVAVIYRELAYTDTRYFQKAIDSWQKAADIDNPEQTRQGLDTWDVADWYQIALAYRDWSEVAYDEAKLSLAVKNVERALAIPIATDNRDYAWHTAAMELQQTLAEYK